ncbi:putative bifunctional diguanylate cyclase/phosphodiesterase [Novosphingobium sp. M1R2S20]|uniref:Bifunctional diguanylate cyclase/phosphodiesterase n=1 Tax=Novosphingobium rhizovicinum TaxID=3228928 RepID=A0ABV3REW6_9SPHN
MREPISDFSEAARLDALQQLKLLDTSPSESFDRITRMASQIFGLPIAAVSLTDSDRQWFKSRVGVAHQSIPRDKAPCAHVAESAAPLIIEDFQADAYYAESVLGRAGTRFYAGAPLITREGYGLGALCVLGTEPRKASSSELAALVDLAAMVMNQIELEHAFGRVDPVSGVPTRNQFRDDLADLARDQAGEQYLAVFVDLARDEQISRIARVMGSAQVDEVVREATRSLQKVLGPDRTVYHISSAQFAFLSPPKAEPFAYMQELRAALTSIRQTSSVRFVTNVAIGVRPFILGEVAADDVLRGAASAAQDARESDGVALYSLSSDLAHKRQYGLLNAFGSALDDDSQLRLVFQPRIELSTGRCIGAEALLRWRHPEIGDVSPGEFIPVIEQTSMARAATQWVLDAAMDQLAAWRLPPEEFALSVNLSAANLAEDDLIARIQLGLLKRGLRPEQIEFELTESAIMGEPDRALAMLREMAATGVCLAIDDFGTGHSSLAYLQRVPARVVKIDQTFVRNLTEPGGADFVLLETMIGLAHKLGFRVVAEGVEMQETAIILAQLGCDEAQGFWFGRPMEPEQFSAWRACSSGVSPMQASA